MKRYFHSLIAATLCLMPYYASAQFVNYPYHFTYSTDVAYTPISAAATELIGSTGWDDETVPFTLPFQFYFAGKMVQSWVMDTYGGLHPVGANDNADQPPILGFYSDYVDRGNSWIGYEVSGATGSRIAKIEFRNMGYFADTLLADSASFQIWLYEGNNKIEYHAGPSKVAPDRFDILNEDGDLILSGLIYTDHGADTPPGVDTFQFIGRVGNVPKDSIVVFNNNTGPSDPELINFINYGIFPLDGTVFTFTPTEMPVAIQEMDESLNSVVFPNPVSDKLTLQLAAIPEKNCVFVLYDVAGRELLRKDLLQRETIIPVASLTNGVYIGAITMAGKKEKTIRIVKQ
jgi:hypothetical protein